MRILIASSELHPYSKTGGLADMVGALGKYLARAGHRVGIVTPYYRHLRSHSPPFPILKWAMDLPVGSRVLSARVRYHRPAPRLTIYFIEQPFQFDRDGLYGDEAGNYPDNAERFAFFSKAAVHLARYLPWQPEIVHAHDWQTGLVPLLIHHQHRTDGWIRPPATLFTIHNLAYQGIFPASQLACTNLPGDYFHPGGIEFYGQVSFLKAGLVYADYLSTVSPRYAREILEPEFGCGFDGLLRQRQNALVGILNGVDYSEWKTRRNPHLDASYDARHLRGKAINKTALQKEMGLAPDPGIPLFGNISRLADQKGFDILIPALPHLVNESAQFISLGSGDPRYESALLDLARRYPDRIAVRIGFDTRLSHRIEAGADFFVMPSRFEPSGLNQLYSLRYGAIPVVRATGGLDDSVVDITEDLDRVNGIKFHDYSAPALLKALHKALALHPKPRLLEFYRVNGMEADFSWRKTVADYQRIYDRIAGQKRA